MFVYVYIYILCPKMAAPIIMLYSCYIITIIFGGTNSLKFLKFCKNIYLFRYIKLIHDWLKLHGDKLWHDMQFMCHNIECLSCI